MAKSGKLAKSALGRPSTFCEEIAETLCERIALGEALHRICKDATMPSARAVYYWLEENGEFLRKYERARARQADLYAEQVVLIPDEATDHNIARLRMDARKWAASKLAPKKYGDRVTQQQEGPDGGPVQHVHRIERVIIDPARAQD